MPYTRRKREPKETFRETSATKKIGKKLRRFKRQKDRKKRTADVGSNTKKRKLDEEID